MSDYYDKDATIPLETRVMVRDDGDGKVYGPLTVISRAEYDAAETDGKSPKPSQTLVRYDSGVQQGKDLPYLERRARADCLRPLTPEEQAKWAPEVGWYRSPGETDWIEHNPRRRLARNHGFRITGQAVEHCAEDSLAWAKARWTPEQIRQHCRRCETEYEAIHGAPEPAPPFSADNPPAEGDIVMVEGEVPGREWIICPTKAKVRYIYERSASVCALEGWNYHEDSTDTDGSQGTWSMPFSALSPIEPEPAAEPDGPLFYAKWKEGEGECETYSKSKEMIYKIDGENMYARMSEMGCWDPHGSRPDRITYFREHYTPCTEAEALASIGVEPAADEGCCTCDTGACIDRKPLCGYCREEWPDGAVECEICQGHGECMQMQCYGGPPVEVDGDCPDCDGKGYTVPAADEKPAERRWFKKEYASGATVVWCCEHGETTQARHSANSEWKPASPSPEVLVTGGADELPELDALAYLTEQGWPLPPGMESEQSEAAEPEQPKFKVGQYVTYRGHGPAIRITAVCDEHAKGYYDCETHAGISHRYHQSWLSLWQPEIGEKVWVDGPDCIGGKCKGHETVTRAPGGIKHNYAVSDWIKGGPQDHKGMYFPLSSIRPASFAPEPIPIAGGFKPGDEIEFESSGWRGPYTVISWTDYNKHQDKASRDYLERYVPFMYHGKPSGHPADRCRHAQPAEPEPESPMRCWIDDDNGRYWREVADGTVEYVERDGFRSSFNTAAQMEQWVEISWKNHRECTEAVALAWVGQDGKDTEMRCWRHKEGRAYYCREVADGKVVSINRDGHEIWNPCYQTVEQLQDASYYIPCSDAEGMAWIRNEEAPTGDTAAPQPERDVTMNKLKVYRTKKALGRCPECTSDNLGLTRHEGKLQMHCNRCDYDYIVDKKRHPVKRTLKVAGFGWTALRWANDHMPRRLAYAVGVLSGIGLTLRFPGPAKAGLDFAWNNGAAVAMFVCNAVGTGWTALTG